jgi:O-antigen ligase
VLALAAAAIVSPRERQRAVLALLALVLSPALLAADLSNSPQLAFARRSPAIAVALAFGGLAVVAVAARVLARNPKAFPYLTALALPFRLPLQVGGDTANLLLPLYLVTGAGAVAWAVPAIRDGSREKREVSLLDWAIAANLAAYALCSIWTEDPTKALQQTVFFLVPFAVMFILLSRIEWTAELIRGCGLVLVALALIFSAIGFYEYATETLLLNPKLLVSNAFHTYFRVNSVFFDPNIFGRFLMFVMLGLAATVIDSRSARTMLLGSAAFAVMLSAMVMTLSQSSLVGLLAGLAAIAVLRFPPVPVAIAVTLVAAAGVVAITVAPSSTGLNLHSLRVLNSESSGRAGLVQGGVDLFSERPIGGWGSGSFSKAYAKVRDSGTSSALTASHTTPVTVAAEQGIIGLALYLLLLVAVFVRAIKGARMSTARAAVTAGLVGLVIHSLTYAAFFEDPAAWVLFALAATLPIPQTREERRAEREARRSGSQPGAPAAA